MLRCNGKIKVSIENSGILHKLFLFLHVMRHMKHIRIQIHVWFWIIVIGNTFYAWQLPYYTPENHWRFCLEILVDHAASMLYFYTVYFWVVPKFLVTQKYLLCALAMLLAMSMHVVICAYAWNGFQFIPGLFRSDQSGIVFACLLYGVMGTGMRLLSYWQESEERRLALLQELKAAELSYLQSQMSPHFLFNTLNNIYGLSLKNAPETSLVIRHLKDIMRYFQQFEHGGKIALKDEIKNLQAFIALHKIRNNVEVVFDLQEDSKDESLYLEPMLLLPSVENAFKHGDIQQPVKIQIRMKNKQLFFHIENHINLSKRKDAVGGIGILNVQKRLELLYPAKYTLSFGPKEMTFNLQLNLDLS